ncbi:MAG: hypothetical protein K6B46_04135, partial [Opitutales bacterium]|nr:hypothetical protein [Opitutales bacterium]
MSDQDPSLEQLTPFPGTWVPTGNVPADFAPVTDDTGAAADSDCDFREYSWTFGGNAPYFQNVFSANLHTTLDLNGKVVGISVKSDDNATVTIEGVGSVASTLNHPASRTFFKTDGSAYSGSFPLHITYNSIGGPWFLEVKIRVMDPFETFPPVEECSCDGSCGMASSARNGSIDFSQAFGGTPFAAGFPKGSLRIYDRVPVNALFSGVCLRYLHPMTRKVVSFSGTNVVIEDALRRVHTYENGRPAGTAVWTDNQVEILDGCVVETLGDRTRISYDADGNAVKIRSREGVELNVSQLGIDVVSDGNGDLAQVWSLTDGLMNVVRISAHKFRIDWYKPADVGAKDAQSGLYAFGGVPVKTFTFGDIDNDGSCSDFEFLEERPGTNHSFHCSWHYDPAARDWLFNRGNA